MYGQFMGGNFVWVLDVDEEEEKLIVDEKLIANWFLLSYGLKMLLDTSSFSQQSL